MLRLALVLLLSLLLPSPALAEKRVALVIGIDKYDNLGVNAQLQRARSDAAAVARVLKELGFDVIAKDDLTRSAFNNHWQDFLNKLVPGDTAVFYFAGHGVEFGGRNYLLPRDVPNIRPGRDELLRREALSLQEFLTDLREKGTRINLVVLDACRDNPFEPLAGRSIGSMRGLAVTEPPEGTFIMFSAGTGESALDRLNNADRDPNSVYTRNLLPLLKTPGLTLTEVAEQVRVAVRQMAATVQHRQTPAYYNQVLGRVCIAGGDCGPRVPAPAQSGEAERAWALAKDTTSIPALEVFIRRFSDTYYGDLAKMRLAELKKAEAASQATEAAKKAEAEALARLETERQRLALRQQEEERKRTEAASAKQAADAIKKKADDVRAKEETERQRLGKLQQEEERKRADAEAARKRGEAAKATEAKDVAATRSDPAKVAALSTIEKEGGARRFDGAWIITWYGKTGCSGMGRSYSIKIEGGIISGQSSAQGSVAPSGAARWTVTNRSGRTVDYSGALRDRSGSGTFTEVVCGGSFQAKRN